MIVDSMNLVSPELTIYKGSVKSDTGQGGFKLGDAYNLIRNISHKLGVRKIEY